MRSGACSETAQPTEPIALVVQGKDEIAAFACAKCHVVASSPLQFIGEGAVDAAREAARRHCGPWFCACGAERGQYRTLCDACWRTDNAKRAAERDAAYVAKAKRVSLADYDGEMLYLESGDKYVTPDDIEDMRADGELPEFAWGCSELRFSLDAEDVIQGQLESAEHHEDAKDWLVDGAYKALQAALDTWRDEYASAVRTFFVDYSILVELGESDGGDS